MSRRICFTPFVTPAVAPASSAAGQPRRLGTTHDKQASFGFGVRF
jgi:hypothetical protein